MNEWMKETKQSQMKNDAEIMTHWNLSKRNLPRGQRYHLLYYFCLGQCLCFFFVLECVNLHEETDLSLSMAKNAKSLKEILFWWDKKVKKIVTIISATAHWKF